MSKESPKKSPTKIQESDHNPPTGEGI